MSAESDAVLPKWRNTNTVLQVPDLVFGQVDAQEFDDECMVEVGEAYLYDDGTADLEVAGVLCELVEGVDVKFSHELLHAYQQDGQWNYFNYGQVNYK